MYNYSAKLSKKSAKTNFSNSAATLIKSIGLKRPNFLYIQNVNSEMCHILLYKSLSCLIIIESSPSNFNVKSLMSNYHVMNCILLDKTEKPRDQSLRIVCNVLTLQN